MDEAARAEDRRLLRASATFAQASVPRAVWQLAVVVLAVGGLVAALFLGGSGWLGLLAFPASIPLFAALVVRAFVLQHDCGHGSLLPSATANLWVGTALSIFTGVPFIAWRDEHTWHHANQGKLHQRGVDMVNSPMTVLEARERPDAARARSRKIRPRTVLVLGAFSILIMRKKASDFFMFRSSFPDPVPNVAILRWSVRLTVVAHLLLHLALALLLGWAWLPVALIAWSGAAAVGASLFWVQHNVEHTWHAGPAEWSLVRVALQGSSYLRLPAPFAWVTANIGLHHVHHLNSRIPNYRLERARREIDALTAVEPLTWTDVKKSVECIFWDEEAGRMVSVGEALP